MYVQLLCCTYNDHFDRSVRSFALDCKKIIASSMFQLILVAASILLATVGASAVVNKEVSRVIDASTSIVRVTTSIKAVNVDGEYQLILPNALASHLAYMSVTSKGNELTVKAPVM